ncbi:TPA: hypothetical protein L9968_002083 [Klebsiella aerogenes]|nr:hypothetical protein [Klebsiella aerogenes]HDU5190417.1 hypothetical protein [Klebsiella aerogenes]
MNKLTVEQLRALAVKKVEALKFSITQSAFTNIRRGLEEELQLAEFALAAMDSELVAEVLSNRPGNDTSTIDRALPVGTQLYRHVQQTVVPDRSIFEKWWESRNGAPLDGWDSLRTNDGYCDDGIDSQFEAWSAAMLAATPQEAK